MLEAVAIFSLVAIMGTVFSVVPVLPGPPFAIVAILLVPLVPLTTGPVDDLTWWVTGTVAALGVLITVIDLAAPWLAKLFEGTIGKSSRQAAIGSIIGLFVGVVLSLGSGCFGIALPILAALPVPLILITPYVGALAGESMVSGPDGETPRERNSRVLRSAFVQWLGLLTTIVLKVGYCIMVVPIGVWLIVRNGL